MAEPTDSGSGPAPILRRWEAPCPNCGAAVPFLSPSSAVAVCSFCRSTVARDGDSLRKLGDSAALIDDRSRLQIGVRGRAANRGFTIVGRVQMGYAADGTVPEGRWSEWHVAFDDGRDGWLSEDNDQFVLVFDVDGDANAPAADALRFDRDLALAGKTWRLASIVTATVLAAEGELPRLPPLGNSHRIADLRNADNQVATLDYADPSRPQLSIGQPVRLADLALQGLVEGPDLALSRQTGRSFDCPDCGAACTPLRADTQSLSCKSCRALIDLSKGVGADLVAYQQTLRVEPAIPLGSSGRLSIHRGPEVTWQVVGFSVKSANERTSEDFFAWHEYLLHNIDEGFAFLIDSEDGWVGYRTLTGVPATAGNGRNVVWQGRRFRPVDEYLARVDYVEGEFYWPVKRDQVLRIVDYKGLSGAIDDRMSSETTDAEQIWSIGTVMSAGTVQRAFKALKAAISRDRALPDGTPSKARANQRPAVYTSYDVGPNSSGLFNWESILVYLLIFAVIAAIAYFDDGDDGNYVGGGYSYSGGGHK